MSTGTHVAIVLNSTPKYYWLLKASVLLLKRYATTCPWHIYIGIEEEELGHADIQFLKGLDGVTLVTLKASEAHFLESRVATLAALPDEIHYVLPLQEDFLLERPGPDSKALEDSVRILDENPEVVCLRYMPCPGPPAAAATYKGTDWKPLDMEDMPFSYQATLWRRAEYSRFLEALIQEIKRIWPEFWVIDETNCRSYNKFCISSNPAEGHLGTQLVQKLFGSRVFLGWPRRGPWANAVYLCPWPYRPTAVVKGIVQPFAKELLEREGLYSASKSS